MIQHFYAILCFVFLAFSQASYACSDHSPRHHTSAACGQVHSHVEVDGNASASSDVITLHTGHHHHAPGCPCVCHDEEKRQPIAPVSNRIDLEPSCSTNSFESDSLYVIAFPTAKACVIARNLSLPPPTSAERCSQHCRYLI